MSRALELASYCDEWPGLVHEGVALELRRLDAEVESLKHALSFYADGSRYYGPNRALDAPDKWSERVGLSAYRLDVTRDGGVIARNALENTNG